MEPLYAFDSKSLIESKCRGCGDFSEMRIITDGRPKEFILILWVIMLKWSAVDRWFGCCYNPDHCIDEVSIH